MHMKGYKKPGELCVAPLLYQYIIVVIGEVAKDKHGTQLLPVILKKTCYKRLWTRQKMGCRI